MEMLLDIAALMVAIGGLIFVIIALKVEINFCKRRNGNETKHKNSRRKNTE